MKKILIWSAIFCIFSTSLMASPVHSSALTIPSIPSDKIAPNEYILKRIASLKIKDLQKLAGRKFSLKEKISFLILKQKLKQKLKHKSGNSQSPGQTALIFGIGAIALLIIGLFVPYVILGSIVASIIAIVAGSSAIKKDPSDRKAHSGKLLGWITLGLTAFLIILAAIVIASWGLW